MDDKTYDELKLSTLLARLAYKEDKRLREELEAIGFELVLIEDVDNVKSPLNQEGCDLRYYICLDPINKIRYVVVRGSSFKLENWVHNFAFWRSKTELGKVHWGFKQEALSLFQHMKKHKDNSITTIGVGHSKGAAIIQMLAPYMGFKKAIGIATPFFATKEYEDNIRRLPVRAEYINVVHSLDIIPLFSDVLFAKLGTTYYIDRKNKIIKNPKTLRIISNTILAFIFKRYNKTSFIHDMLFYHSYRGYIDFFRVDHRKAKNK